MKKVTGETEKMQVSQAFKNTVKEWKEFKVVAMKD